MKNKSKKLIMSLFLIIPLFSLSSCNKKASDENKNKEESITKGMFDLTGFTTNIKSASAVGISTKEISPITTLANEDKQENNEIILNKFGSTDGTNLKMTFSKVVPNENEEEITVIDEYVALSDMSNDDQSNNASITFLMSDGFEYSLYYDNQGQVPVEGCQNIKDGSSIDNNEKKDFVTIGGLTSNTIYYLKYTGNGKYIKKSQEDLNVEIDKLYSTGNFTFVSFVPKGQSNRPIKNAYYKMMYEENNVLDYDKKDYFSNLTNRKSYVIDNKSGLIYYIDNFKIKGFENGLLDITLNVLEEDDIYDKDYRKKMQLYNYVINENNEFELIQLYNSESIIVESGFKDKYGNIFIKNDIVNEYDEATKTRFYTESNDDNFVYYLNSNDETIRTTVEENEYRYYINDVKKLNNNEYVDLSKDEEFTFNKNILGAVSSSINSPIFYKNGRLYNTNSANNYFETDSELKFGYFDLLTKQNHLSIGGDVIAENLDLTEDYYRFSACGAYLDNGVLIVINNGKAYYVNKVFEKLDEYFTSNNTVNNFKLTHFLDNCTINYQRYENITTIKKPSLNDDIIYDLVLEKDNNDEYIVKAYEYTTSIEPLRITLQPINK